MPGTNYEAKYLAIAKDIVLKHVDNTQYAVFLFGSRAKGRHGRSADVDIGIAGDKPLDCSLVAAIQEELDASIVPYHVDIVDFYSVDSHFRQHALRSAVIWNKTKNFS